MPKLNYWRIMYDDTYGREQLTMLASGEDHKDLERLKEELLKDIHPGSPRTYFELWMSDQHGDMVHEDGKDMFRKHHLVRQYLADVVPSDIDGGHTVHVCLLYTSPSPRDS